MGAGSVAEACQAAVAAGCLTGVDYEGEYRVDWTNKLSDGLEHPVIHSTFGYAATDGDRRPPAPAPSRRWWPPTTWAGPSTRCCARARSRAASTWASATP